MSSNGRSNAWIRFEKWVTDKATGMGDQHLAALEEADRLARIGDQVELQAARSELADSRARYMAWHGLYQARQDPRRFARATADLLQAEGDIPKSAGMVALRSMALFYATPLFDETPEETAPAPSGPAGLTPVSAALLKSLYAQAEYECPSTGRSDAYLCRGELSKGLRGNLTDLKRKGLVETSEADAPGDLWVVFTAEGWEAAQAL